MFVNDFMNILLNVFYFKPFIKLLPANLCVNQTLLFALWAAERKVFQFRIFPYMQPRFAPANRAAIHSEITLAILLIL